MFRTIMGAFVLFGVLIATATAEEFHAMITKVDNGKVTLTRMKKGETKFNPKLLEEQTLVVDTKAKVFKGRLRKQFETYPLDAADELQGGLDNERFKKIEGKGYHSHIITDDTSNAIKEIRVLIPLQKKAP